jgi:Mlc titration factor MtfA (ptsG expression regulator)
MLAWFRRRRRRKIMKQPFPETWRHILEDRFPHYPYLNGDEKCRLHQMIQVFIAEKRFEGAGGFALTDEVRVLVAAHACLLILGLSFEYYREVETILVYPSDMVRPTPLFGDRYTHGKLFEKEAPLAGEAIHGGPVLIAWDAVEGSPDARFGKMSYSAEILRS